MAIRYNKDTRKIEKVPDDINVLPEDTAGSIAAPSNANVTPTPLVNPLASKPATVGSYFRPLLEAAQAGVRGAVRGYFGQPPQTPEEMEQEQATTAHLKAETGGPTEGGYQIPLSHQADYTNMRVDENGNLILPAGPVIPATVMHYGGINERGDTRNALLQEKNDMLQQGLDAKNALIDAQIEHLKNPTPTRTAGGIGMIKQAALNQRGKQPTDYLREAIPILKNDPEYAMASQADKLKMAKAYAQELQQIDQRGFEGSAPSSIQGGEWKEMVNPQTGKHIMWNTTTGESRDK